MNDNWIQALRTVQNVTGKVSGGFLKAFESILDFGTRTVAFTGQSLGANTQKIWDFADKDLVEDYYYKPLGVGKDSLLQGSKVGEVIDKGSEMVGGIMAGITMGAGAKAAASSLGVTNSFLSSALSTMPIGLKQAGRASGQAMQSLYEQAGTTELSITDRLKGMAYGTMSGITEWAISNISRPGEVYGMLGEDLVKQTGKEATKEIIKGALGEGFESAISSIADPFLKKLTYSPDTHLLKDDADTYGERAKQVARDALIASAISATTQTAQHITKGIGENYKEKKMTKAMKAKEAAETSEAEYLLGLNKKTLEEAEIEDVKKTLKAPSFDKEGGVLELRRKLEKVPTEVDTEPEIKEKMTTQEIEKIKDPVVKTEKTLDKAVETMQQNMFEDNYLERLQEQIDLAKKTKIKAPTIKEENQNLVLRKKLEKTSEELFKELKSPEYAADPVERYSQQNSDSEMLKYKQFLQDNIEKGEMVEGQVKDSMLGAKGFSKSTKKVIKQDVSSEHEKSDIGGKQYWTKEYIAESAGKGESFNPLDERVLYFLSDNNTDEVLPVKTIIDLAEESRFLTTDKERKRELREFISTATQKFKDVSHDWSVKGNEIQAAYGEDVFQDKAERIQEHMDSMLKRDIKKVESGKINESVYKIDEAKVEKAEAIWDEETKIIEEAKAAGRYRAAQDAETRRDKRMFLELTKEIPATIGEKAREWRQVSMLANLRTLVGRNPMGNIESLILDKTNFMKGAMNWVNKKFVGVDTSLSAEENIKMQKIYAETLYKRAKQTFTGGSDNLDNKYMEDVGGGPLDRTKLSGKAANLVYKTLSFFDDPFEEAAYAAEKYRAEKIIRKGIEDGNIKKINDSEIGIMAHRMAEHKAQVMTFKDQNAWTGKIDSLKNKLNEFRGFRTKYGYGLGDQLITFVKTPTNVAKFAWDHMPVSAIMKTKDYMTAKSLMKKNATAENLADFDIASQNLAKSLYGAVLQTLSVVGGYYGILEANEHKRGQYDETSFNKQMLGKKGFAINIGGKRIPLGNLDITNILLSPAVSKGETLRDKKEHPDEDKSNYKVFEEIILSGAEQQIDALLEQASLKSFNVVFKGYTANGLEGAKEAIGREIAGIPTQFIPTFIQQSAKAMDPKERQVYERAMMGNMKNQILGAIPGLRQTLPEKKDVFGETIVNYDDAKSFSKNLLNKMLLPEEIKDRRDDPLVDEIERLAISTNENVYPYAVPTRLDGKDLKAGEISENQKIAGQRFYKNATELMKTQKYQKGTDEEKAKMMKELAKTPSKQEMKKGNEPLTEEQQKEATTFNFLNKSGIDPKVFKDINYAGGTQEDKINAIDDLDIDGFQKVILFKTLYPKSNLVSDETMYNSLVSAGLSQDEIFNYGKLTGLILDNNPLRYDEDVANRDLYNEMQYGLKAIDEREMITDSLSSILVPEAPKIMEQAKSLAQDEEQLIEFLDSLDIDGIQKMIMYKKILPKKNDFIDSNILQHIMSLDISEREKKRILNELKIKVE